MLALAEMWHRKGQFIIIAVIVALVAYLALMMNGLGTALLDESAVKQLDADLLVFAADTQFGYAESELSKKRLPRSSRLPRSRRRRQSVTSPSGHGAMAKRRSRSWESSPARSRSLGSSPVGRSAPVSGAPCLPTRPSSTSSGGALATG